MTKFEALKNQYQKALKRFEEVLEKKENDIVRDSAIKRFEFVFDLSWKLIKAYLSEEKGVVCSSPKDCFRQAYQNNILEYDDFWLELTDWRNEIVHSYSEEFADSLYQKLPGALRYFQALKNNLAN